MILEVIGNSKLDHVQKLLSEFSSKVDGLIFDLIRKYLQVYNEESNSDGWFNYDFSSTELWLYSIDALNSENFDDFVKSIFEILWYRTDDNLELIRSKIENEILESLEDEFELD